MPVMEQVYQGNRKINTVPGFKFIHVKIVRGVTREAIYHVKGIYTYAFKSSSTRMAQSFHMWLRFAPTQRTDPIPPALPSRIHDWPSSLRECTWQELHPLQN